MSRFGTGAPKGLLSFCTAGTLRNIVL